MTRLQSVQNAAAAGVDCRVSDGTNHISPVLRPAVALASGLEAGGL